MLRSMFVSSAIRAAQRFSRSEKGTHQALLVGLGKARIGLGHAARTRHQREGVHAAVATGTYYRRMLGAERHRISAARNSTRNVANPVAGQDVSGGTEMALPS